MRSRLLVLLFFCPLLCHQPASARSNARIGSGVVFLNPETQGIEFIGKISPDGNFAIGLSITSNSLEPGSLLDLWDLRNIDPDGGLVKPKPFHSFDLNPSTEQYFDNGHLAFSPDSRYLVVLLSSEFLLLRVPDLSVANRLPLANADAGWQFGAVLWSPDGKWLVTWYGSQIAAWNFESGKGTILTDDSVQSLEYFAGGWLIEDTGAFRHCTPSLKDCQSTTIDQPVMALDESRKLVITGDFWDPNDTGAFTAWQQANDGFHITHQFFTEVKHGLTNFSPDGHYATQVEWSKGQNPDYAHYTLYDLEAHKSLYEVGQPPTWLANTGYFVIDGELFHPSVSHQAISHISGLDALTNEEIGMYPEELFLVNSFSDDGRWYLWGPGATAFAVPVIIDG